MPSRRRSGFPRAVVLVSGGTTGEGALCVLRGLGRLGVPITVLAEGPGTHAAASRYCDETLVVPELSRKPDQALSFLLDYARRQAVEPVLFPTADPDLLLSQLRDNLAPSCRLVIPSREHVDAFVDKARFHQLAERHGFPVPRTFVLDSSQALQRASIELRYPVIVKPSGAKGWRSEVAEVAARYKKAIRLESRDELIALYDRIAASHPDLLVQEFIQGPDAARFDVHIYMDRASQPVAFFTGQKIRIFPAYAGCFVQSVIVEHLVQVTVPMLQAVGYRGLANINFKRDVRDGEFKLMEVNPRVSQWNILPTRCQVNLPFVAYAEAAGLPYTPPGRQVEGVQYLSFKNDLKAFLEYRRNGDWTWRTYLVSLLRGRKVHQHLAFDDLRPFAVEALNLLGAIANRLRPRGHRSS